MSRRSRKRFSLVLRRRLRATVIPDTAEKRFTTSAHGQRTPRHRTNVLKTETGVGWGRMGSKSLSNSEREGLEKCLYFLPSAINFPLIPVSILPARLNIYFPLVCC
jgi:hypothetical protein